MINLVALLLLPCIALAQNTTSYTATNLSATTTAAGGTSVVTAANVTAFVTSLALDLDGMHICSAMFNFTSPHSPTHHLPVSRSVDHFRRPRANRRCNHHCLSNSHPIFLADSATLPLLSLLPTG